MRFHIELPLLSIRAAAAASILAVALGCGASDTTAPQGDQPPAPSPAAVTLTSAGPSAGPFGATLRSPFEAKVTDGSGKPVRGVSVTFAVDSGGVLSPSTVTDSAGIAKTRVRLPITRGTVTLTATAGTKQASITLTVTGITFAHLALGQQSTCGISVEGYGYCWGRPYGVLGISGDSINVPTPMLGANAFQSITTGGTGGCGISADSTAVCWGAIPASATSPPAYVPPTAVPGNLKFQSLSQGDYDTCGVTVAGVVYCWGWNYTGQLGSSAVSLGSYTLTPIAVELSGATFASVYVGQYHVCALSNAGQAYCWGQNLTARAVTADGNSVACTGLTLTGCVVAPAAVSASLHFTSLAIGSNSTCGIESSGNTYCWGANESGELGTGDTVSSATPRQVSTTLRFSQISGGDRGFCGLTTSGDVYCWGALTTGVGVPGGTCPVSGWDCNTSPAAASSQGLHFTSIASREGEACGLAAGVAYCWGFNWAGKLGTGVTANHSAYPQPIANQP